jgi:hypothetical protein
MKNQKILKERKPLKNTEKEEEEKIAKKKFYKVSGHYKRTGFFGLRKIYVRPHLRKRKK